MWRLPLSSRDLQYLVVLFAPVVCVDSISQDRMNPSRGLAVTLLPDILPIETPNAERIVACSRVPDKKMPGDPGQQEVRVNGCG